MRIPGAGTILATLLVAVPAGSGVFIVSGPNGESKIVNVPGIERGGPVPRGSSTGRKELWPAVQRLAREHGVDPNLIDLMIRMESGYDARAVSSKGARGIMQLMPDTARSYGVSNTFNSYENIRAGVRYFSDLLERFGSDLALALAAYNAGPEAVAKHGGIPPYRETRRYVSAILTAYQANGGGPVLTGGFGRPQRSRPVELRSDANGTVISNAARHGEPALERRLTLR